MYGTDATEQNVRYYNLLQKIIKIIFSTHFSTFFVVAVVVVVFLVRNQIAERKI